MTSLTGLSLALALASAPTHRGEVLDFSAKWCGPCQQVAPLVARLERDGLPIRSVDVDQNRALAQRFNVTAMPTFVLIVDGQEVDRHVGMMGEAELRAWLSRIPKKSSPPEIAQGTAPRSSGQSAGGSGYVADPSVRLGSPQPFQIAEANPAPTQPAFQPREEPQRTQVPKREEPSRGGLLGLLSGRSNAAPEREEIRASDALLNEPAPQPPKSTPMAASVRLRVTVNGRINLGSGTIVASDAGKALIVTCGHIFRGFSEDSRIEVNLFGNNTEQSLNGQLVKFNEEADVGLVMIDVDRPLPTVPVGRDVQKARAQETVLSIGCSGGQPPTAAELVVTEVNPYLGPDNLECTGVPVQGRSGGGLFKSSGELIGVCIAADPDRKRGVYAGLLAVHDLLDESGYASLFRTPETALAATREFPAEQPFAEAPAANLSANTNGGTSLLDSLSPAGDWPRGETLPPRGGANVALAGGTNEPTPAMGGTPVQLGPEADDAEIVCIIRPRNQPEAASRVVVIHQASPKMLSYLRGEMRQSLDAQATDTLLSRESQRRPRTESIPTMGVSPARPLPSRVESSQIQSHSRLTQKPGLRPTALSTPIQPRRYVRSR